MILTPAQAEALLQKIESSLDTLVTDTNSAISRIEHDSSWIPLVGHLIAAGLEKLRSLVQEFVDKVDYYLTAFNVPTYMGQYSDAWLAIASQAGGVASNIADMNQRYGNEWQGIAGPAYQNGVSNQGAAVDAIQSRANSASSACNSLEQAGYTYYIAALAITAGLITAAVGWETVVLAVAGVIAALAGIAAAVAALVFGIQGVTNSFKQLLEPTDTLPGDDWPLATT
jgi:hypothetical protein